MIGWIILGALVLIIFILIGMYNSLVRLKVTTDNAWADIDVQLKRRYDLIPNLVETVKGYAGHEKGTLEAVINARNRAMSATSPAEKAQAENMLSGTLKSLFALSEAYPQLRAIESFTSLQNTLSQIEDFGPVWLRLRLDITHRRLLRLRMITAGHFMTQEWGAFNRPLHVQPPPAREVQASPTG